MSLDALLAKSAAARAFDVQYEGRTYKCRLPTPFEQRRTTHQFVKDDRSIDFLGFERALVDAAVLGWEGVTERDFLPESETDAAVEFSAAALKALLDLRLDVLDALLDDFRAKLAERSKRLEAEKKP